MDFPGGDGLLLYAGTIQVSVEGKSASGLGEVHLVWRPSPRFRCAYRFTDDPNAYALAFRDPGSEEIGFVDVDEGSGSLQFPLTETSEPGSSVLVSGSATVNGKVFGSGRSLFGLRVHLVNFVNWDLVWLSHGDDLVFEAGDWTLTISAVLADEAKAADAANLAGGFVVTHVAHIARRDSSSFAREDAEPVLHTLFHWCTLVRGALVGQLLPEGLDRQGSVVYAAWTATTMADWRDPFGWCESSCMGDAARMFHRWMERDADPFWKQVLTRATRIYASANEPNPLDVAIPTVLTGLELLAWAVLVVTEEWVRPLERELTAAGMIRLLLRWAGIPTAIPPELSHLASYPTGVDNPDLPTALTQVRNRLVHPPRTGTPAWPSADVMTDAWRIGLEVIELVILRLLDYDGKYGHRRHLEGRWQNDTISVPWASEKPTST